MMINTKPASQLSIWVREEGHVNVVRISLHVPLARVLFTISPNRELAHRFDDEMPQFPMYEISKPFRCIECFSVDQEHAIS